MKTLPSTIIKSVMPYLMKYTGTYDCRNNQAILPVYQFEYKSGQIVTLKPNSVGNWSLDCKNSDKITSLPNITDDIVQKVLFSIVNNPQKVNPADIGDQDSNPFFPYLKHEFSSEQMNVINEGITLELNYHIYANPSISVDTMSSILNSLKDEYVFNNKRQDTDVFEIIKFINDTCKYRGLECEQIHVINNRTVLYKDVILASFSNTGTLAWCNLS